MPSWLPPLQDVMVQTYTVNTHVLEADGLGHAVSGDEALS